MAATNPKTRNGLVCLATLALLGTLGMSTGSARGQCSPALLGTADTPGSAFGVTVAGNVAYVGDGASGLQVIDVSNPASPVIVGTADTPGFAFDVAVSGTVAYVADDTSGVQVIDVSNPASPVIIGSVATSALVQDLVVSGTLVYAANQFDGLAVIDVSTPASPVVIGSVDTPTAARGIAISGTTVYIADDGTGLHVIDVSTPAIPVIVGFVATPGFAEAVAVSGTLAYVADHAAGLQVIDVSNPASPAVLGTADTPGEAWGVAVSGSTVYVADRNSGLQVIDVSNPASPSIIGSIAGLGPAFDVAVSNAVAYVVADGAGMRAIDVSCAPDIAVTKTVSDAEPFEGDEIVYTVTVTNEGTESASFVAIEDVLPAGVTFVGLDFISQGTYDEIGGTWNIGSIAIGTTDTLEIRVSVDAGTAATTGTGDFIDSFVEGGVGLELPSGVTFGPDGNLYVSSAGSSEVLRYDGITGAFIDAFVAPGLGGLFFPNVLAFGRDGDLFVVGIGSDNVIRYDGITGALVGVFISGVDGPQDLVFGPDGNVYVSILHSDDVRRYDGVTGAFIDNFVTAGLGGLDGPAGMAFGADGNLYVASWLGDQVLRYDGGTGAFIDAFVTAGSGGLVLPEGMRFGPDGNLYVSSSGTHEVLRYDGSTGAFIDAFATAGSGGLQEPIGLTFGPDGNMYVSSSGNSELLRYEGFINNVARLQEIGEIDPNALNNQGAAGLDVQAVATADLIVSKFVSNDTPGEGDQIVYTVAVFNNGSDDATGVTVDDALPTGVTFVQVDSVTQGSYDDVLGVWDVGALANGASAVLEIRVSVDAGTAETTGTGEFIDLFTTSPDAPTGLTFDLDGNLYVGSQTLNIIEVFDATGTPLDPISTGEELDGPRDMTIGPDGNLYVCSISNDAVLRYDPATGDFIDEFTSGTAPNNPFFLTFGPDGNLYVSANPNVLRYDGTTGGFIDTFVSIGSPRGLAFGSDGSLYVATEATDEIQRFDGVTGAFIDVFATASSPRGIRFGPDGNLFVADLITNGVDRYDGTTGAFIDTFVPQFSGGLNTVQFLAFGEDGNLYVPGLNSDAVYRYQGFITNVATLSALNETDPNALDNQASAGITVRASGACCTFGGVCQVVSENTCNNFEGDYQGDGTTCEPFPCPVKCCLPDGSCIDINSSDCFLAGGQSDPPGSTCFAGSCPDTGACCIDDGTCVNLTSFGCDAIGGGYLGDLTSCGVDPCIGACCFEPSGLCENQDIIACTGGGGTFQGFNTSCGETFCPGDFGACCIGDFCTETTEYDCEELQVGFFVGFGTTCASDPCPRRCCLSDGSCIETDTADCLAQSGEPGPLGSVCDGESCPQPGACCLDGTDCQVITPFACVAQGGVFEGGEACGSFTCSGACCTSGGFCEILTFFECTEYIGGLYQGNDTTCVSDPCFEACCLEGGECQDLLPVDCEQMGGTPQGLGVLCIDNPCPVVGACCFANGTCQNLTAVGCAGAGGYFKGAGSSCETTGCPPRGACCLLDLSCIFTIPSDCVAMAGVFKGAGTVCDAGACPDPGEVLAEGKISQSSGGFGGTLIDFGAFGGAVAALGDLDGDGVRDLAVGAPAPPIPGDGSLFIEGVVYVILLNGDGTVKSESAIGAFTGGFGGDIAPEDQFGAGLAAIGDINGDGVRDLAVGAPGDDDDDGGGSFNDDGAVYILFMNPDGTTQSSQKISDTAGGFTGGLSPFDRFGTSVTALGDFDGDAIPDIAVGAPGDDDLGNGVVELGALWILLLNADGTVKADQKISAANPFLTGELEAFDNFGASVAALGDLNDDGVVDLAVGAPGDDDGGNARGAIYIVLLDVDGAVAAVQKISDTAGGFVSGLGDVDLFGSSVAALGDLDGDGLPDVAVGAPLDDDAQPGGGPLPDTNRGAVWIVLLNADGTVRGNRKVSDTIGEFNGPLADFDEFGSSLRAIGDLDGNGVTELAVGAPGDDDGGTNRGATWILFLDGDAPINFAEPQLFVADGAPNVAAVGDLDTAVVPLPGFAGDIVMGGGADGLLPPNTPDVAVIIPSPTGGNGVVQIFRNKGTAMDGTWLEFLEEAPQPLTYFVGPDPTDITLGLFNGDGYLDIAVTNAGNDTVSILFNDANDLGTFTLVQTLTGFQNPSAIAAGEFLGIVQLPFAVDLVVANQDANNIVFIENDGTGNFALTEAGPLGVGPSPKAIDPLDLDNDKDMDLAVGGGALFAGGMAWAVQIIVNENESNEFVVDSEVPTGEDPTDLATGDLDGDGDVDIVSSNRGDGTATVIENGGPALGNGAGAQFSAVLELLVGDEPLSVDMADLDGDGDQDLALTAKSLLDGPTVQVLENLLDETEDLEFEPPLSVDVLADPVFVSSGDFDGNGLSDIVTANEDPQSPDEGSVTVVLGEPELPCPTDINSDGVTDFGDILELLANWGVCTKTMPCPGDLNQDSYTNFADLLILLGGFGPC